MSKISRANESLAKLAEKRTNLPGSGKCRTRGQLVIKEKKRDKQKARQKLEATAEKLKNDGHLLYSVAANMALGYRGGELARRANVAVNELPRIINLLKAEWAHKRGEAMNVYVEKQLIALDQVIVKAVDGFEESVRNGVLKTKEKRDEMDNVIETVTERTHKGTGDTKFLGIALQALRDRAEVLNIRTIKHEHSGSVDVNISEDEKREHLEKLSEILKQSKPKLANLPPQMQHPAFIEAESRTLSIEAIKPKIILSDSEKE